ncbi:hypothetical protein HDU91_000132, partial [Kappamyces sp. JEL0680]
MSLRIQKFPVFPGSPFSDPISAQLQLRQELGNWENAERIFYSKEFQIAASSDDVLKLLLSQVGDLFSALVNNIKETGQLFIGSDLDIYVHKGLLAALRGCGANINSLLLQDEFDHQMLELLFSSLGPDFKRVNLCLSILRPMEIRDLVPELAFIASKTTISSLTLQCEWSKQDFGLLMDLLNSPSLRDCRYLSLPDWPRQNDLNFDHWGHAGFWEKPFKGMDTSMAAGTLGLLLQQCNTRPALKMKLRLTELSTLAFQFHGLCVLDLNYNDSRKRPPASIATSMSLLENCASLRQVTFGLLLHQDEVDAAARVLKKLPIETFGSFCYGLDVTETIAIIADHRHLRNLLISWPNSSVSLFTEMMTANLNLECLYIDCRLPFDSLHPRSSQDQAATSPQFVPNHSGEIIGISMGRPDHVEEESRLICIGEVFANTLALERLELNFFGYSYVEYSILEKFIYSGILRQDCSAFKRPLATETATNVSARDLLAICRKLCLFSDLLPLELTQSIVNPT